MALLQNRHVDILHARRRMARFEAKNLRTIVLVLASLCCLGLLKQAHDAMVAPGSQPGFQQPVQSLAIAESVFADIVSEAFAKAAKPVKPFIFANLFGWNKPKGSLGGKNHEMIADFYRSANSVFEYGLGESTKIAQTVGVPRYSGVDSDAEWIVKARESAPPHFRFYFADIGATGEGGYPQETLKKNVYNYQLAPLVAELSPFDVYMVHGRWSLSCLFASFLHASAGGANHADTIVLLDKCVIEGSTQPAKFIADTPRFNQLLERIRFSGDSVCAYKRKDSTSDDDLLELWRAHLDVML